MPVFGLADTHAHFMAELGFGGAIFWGQAYADVPGSAEDRLKAALGPRKGGIAIGDIADGGRGYPEFDQWPRFSTLLHQQAYLDWIYRAYQGGLRLVSCLCVNSWSIANRLYNRPDIAHLLANLILPQPLPYKDKAVIDSQLTAIKNMEKFVEQHQGGWLKIAYTSQDARSIIESGKLAVVLGVEVDALGDWHTPQDLEAAAIKQNRTVREVIRCELERLYQQGVRQITPIHLANNPFGGSAVYKVLFNTVNIDLSGTNFQMEDGFEADIRYRMDMDPGDPAPKFLLEILGILQHETGDYLAELRTFKSHRNKQGLTNYGEILIEEMIRLHMIIDIDHMGDKSKDKTIEIVTKHGYPIICSHALGFRDLAITDSVPYERDYPRTHYHTSHIENIPSEFHARHSDLTAIRDLGGMVSVLANQREVKDFDGPNGYKETDKVTVENNNSGSTRSWAQAYLYAREVMGGKNVGLGTDVNGLAGLPGPRFGPNAAHELEKDTFRDPDGKLRAEQAIRQTNGVQYAEPLRTTDAFRYNGTAFDGEGDGALIRDIWRALALWQANGDTSSADRASHIAVGLQAGLAQDESQLDCGPLSGDCSIMRRAAYLVASESEPTSDEAEDVLRVYGKIKRHWESWQTMEGLNDPTSEDKLQRLFLGEKLRDYDFNLDGFAHYGMMPDFRRDLRNIGLRDEHLESLYHSAESYIQTWEKCVLRSAEIFGKITPPTLDCPDIE